MRFITKGIGDELLDVLADAREVRIAVAYFRPDAATLNELRTQRKLKLVISEEFTVTNPHLLGQLPRGSYRSVPTDDPHGRLHAKVILVQRRNGGRWAFVGSANMTTQGMLFNQEAGVILDAESDSKVVDDVEKWFDYLWARSIEPDLVAARAIFDGQQNYQLVRRSTAGTAPAPGYWSLKATEGATGDRHWLDFQAEGVIAIGWPGVRGDPSLMTDVQLRRALTRFLTPGQIGQAFWSIRGFEWMPVGSLILLCRGYNATQRADVSVYGVARVTGYFYDDAQTRWNWRFKREAVIQPVNQTVARNTIAGALGWESLMLTIHELDQRGFGQLMQVLGVQVQV